MSDDRPTTQTTYREPLQPTTDLRARLDAAITAARRSVQAARAIDRGTCLNRYTALVELRARWDATAYLASTMTDAGYMDTFTSVRHAIEADVRRLIGMPVDGSTEAESARKQDQPSG